MQDECKWNYNDHKFNLKNSIDKTQQDEKLFNLYENSRKKELQGIFDVAIKIKYHLYKDFLFMNNFFLFKSLENNIKESAYCLMIGAHTASITNTNLILERAIKLALIQFQAGKLIDLNDNNLVEKYIESDKKYSGKNLDENIQTCQKFKILNKEEAKELKEYKVKFRDGFSHFTPKNILKDENSLIHITDNLSQDPSFDRYLKLTTFQSIEVGQFAVNNSENHLRYVLKIVNHLQYKILEKFSMSKNCS